MDDSARFASHIGIPLILIQSAELDGVLDELIRVHTEGMRWKDFSDDEQFYGGNINTVELAHAC